MTAPLPPEWARRRDGRLVPFDADRICRALFAATAALGRPDAFLARELADGAVHFLAHDGDPLPTTAQIADHVARAVRELGHPALAAAFAARRRAPAERAFRLPADAAPAAVRAAFARHAVFAPDLVAAADAGLLTLDGPDAPEILAAVVVPAFDGLLDALAQARAFAAAVALDGPDHHLARSDNPVVNDLARELAVGLRLSGLRAVVNLNAATPPSGAGVADGPLFAERPPPPERRAAAADALADALADVPGLRLDWHLADADFVTAGRARLLRQARRALDGDAAFVFDRPRRPVALAEGLDRAHPAALLTVGVDLGRLADQPGVGGPDALLAKVGSLARLALSAGSQKRAYLRRHGAAALADGFLLDCARLVVAPLSLDEARRRLGATDDLPRRLVQRLRVELERESARLDTCLAVPDDAGALTVADAATPEALAARLEELWRGGAVVRARVGKAGPRQLTLDGAAPR